MAEDLLCSVAHEQHPPPPGLPRGFCHKSGSPAESAAGIGCTWLVEGCASRDLDRNEASSLGRGRLSKNDSQPRPGPGASAAPPCGMATGLCTCVFQSVAEEGVECTAPACWRGGQVGCVHSGQEMGPWMGITNTCYRWTHRRGVLGKRPCALLVSDPCQNCHPSCPMATGHQSPYTETKLWPIPFCTVI